MTTRKKVLIVLHYYDRTTELILKKHLEMVSIEFISQLHFEEKEEGYGNQFDFVYFHLMEQNLMELFMDLIRSSGSKENIFGSTLVFDQASKMHPDIHEFHNWPVFTDWFREQTSAVPTPA
jgi:hypothetical protein